MKAVQINRIKLWSNSFLSVSLWCMRRTTTIIKWKRNTYLYIYVRFECECASSTYGKSGNKINIAASCCKHTTAATRRPQFGHICRNGNDCKKPKDERKSSQTQTMETVMQIGFAQKSTASLNLPKIEWMHRRDASCWIRQWQSRNSLIRIEIENVEIPMETQVKRIRLMAFNWNKWKMKIEYNGVELVCTLSLVRLAPSPFANENRRKKISHPTPTRKVNFVGWLKYCYVCVCVCAVRKYVCTNSNARMPLRQNENECCIGLHTPLPALPLSLFLLIFIHTTFDLLFLPTPLRSHDVWRVNGRKLHVVNWHFRSNRWESTQGRVSPSSSMSHTKSQRAESNC